MADKLEDMYYMSRRPSIRWISGRAPLGASDIACLCYRIQAGLPKDRALAEVREQVFGFERLFSYVGQRAYFTARGRLQPPLLVGQEALPGALVKELVAAAITRNPDARKTAGQRTGEVEFLYQFYDQLVMEEWNRLTEHVRSVFASEATSRLPGEPAWRYYQKLRPYYLSRGITDPPAFLKRIRSNATFLGVPLVGGAHEKMLEALRRAERVVDQITQALGQKNRQSLLRTWPLRKKSIGCFVPRTTDQGRFSNHAAGLAIDIDADWNPFLRGVQATVLNQVLAWMKARGLTTEVISITESWLAKGIKPTDPRQAEELFAKAAAASNGVRKFLDGYLDAWFARASQGLTAPASSPDGEAHELVEKMFNAWGGKGATKGRAPSQWTGYRALIKLRTDGLITLPMELFVALLRAGLSSGLEYVGGKDEMHFEIFVETIVNTPPPKNPCRRT